MVAQNNLEVIKKFERTLSDWVDCNGFDINVQEK